MRRVRADRHGVEHDEVRHRAVAQHTPVTEPEARGRRGGHPPDRLLEAQDALVANELAENPGEAAVRARARLRAEERGVRSDHADRVAEEPPDPVGVRARRHLARAQALSEEEVAERVDGVDARLVDQLAQRSALPAGVLGPREVAEPDVAEAA